MYLPFQASSDRRIWPFCRQKEIENRCRFFRDIHTEMPYAPTAIENQYNIFIYERFL